MFQFFLKLARTIFGRATIRATYRSLVHGEKNQGGLPGAVLTALVWPLWKTGVVTKWLKLAAADVQTEVTGYSKASIDLSINAIHSMPEVVVTAARPQTINLLVPAFSIKTMSAGFFGVFQLALLIAREGYHVRLVLFDNFYFDRDVFRRSLLRYPGLETLLDEVEIDYVGDRYQPLKVSPNDNAVATVWYSAYFARKIMSTIGGGPFLYLIQDYEAAFYPFSSLYSLADATYSFNYHAIVSTKPLYDFMQGKARYFASLCKDDNAAYFNNACAASLPDKSTFMANHAGKTRRLAFYSRPMVNRNMFELGARALIEAWNNGYFNTGHNWELYGIGIGEVEIHLDARTKVTQLPRMSLAEYEEKISQFDICISLMASPHPSITPFDLAGVGALVVTNTFENKTLSYFAEISENILVSPPDIMSLADTIRLALNRIDELDARYEGAVAMNYPRTWNEVWNSRHRTLLRNTFGEPPSKQRYEANVRSRPEAAPRLEATDPPVLATAWEGGSQTPD